MNTPHKPKNVPDPVPIPENDFDEFLEWTQEEEEEFMRILHSTDADPEESR
jgi:hypothetical protein